MIKISREDALITVELLPNDISRVNVNPVNKDLFVPVKTFETKYSIELINKILEIKGSDYLCDELAREEDPTYVKRDLEDDLKAYFPNEDFSDKTILDFGCGSGASSIILSRIFPKAKIIGVELEEKLLSIAKARLDFYKYKNIEFYLSPNGNELPKNIGQFDLVIMSAVYEHLLPEERKTVVPLIWESIKENGFFFMNMTPHRYFPVEHHTTGLPLINYLPDILSYQVAKKFSKRIDPSESWEILLRRGIRGGTENEILAILKNNQANKVKLLEPNTAEIKDRIDLWYSQLNQERLSSVKKIIRFTLKSVKLFTGMVIVPNLSLVFQKK